MDRLSRPASPWTPSYSVTMQGPGVESADLQQDTTDATSTAEDIEENDVLRQDNEASTILTVEAVNTGASETERPKSPFPPSYSVTQQGPDGQEHDLTTANVAQHDDEITKDSSASELDAGIMVSSDSQEESGEASVLEAASHIPEVPTSPRTSLGTTTPGFDTRSEVSDASRYPLPASTPRSEPGALSPTEAQTPLISSVLESGEEPTQEEVPEGTPLISALQISSRSNEMTPESALPAVVLDPANRSNSQSLEESPELASASLDDDEATSSMFEQTIEHAHGGMEEFKQEVADSAIGIAKVLASVTAQQASLKEIQPIAVTTTFSKDSAYTQATDDSFASGFSNDTSVTTPDVETLVMPKLDTSSNTPANERSADATDDETARQKSVGPASAEESPSRTPHRLSGSVVSLGIGQSFAAKTFPPAFPSSRSQSSDQVK